MTFSTPQCGEQRKPKDGQHERIQGAEVHRELVALEGCSTNSLRLEELTSRLTSLQALLKAAEQGGVLVDIARMDPRFLRESERLAQERKELASALATLLVLATSTDCLDEGLWSKVRHWVVRALKHDDDEDLLLMNAVNQDLGAAD
jgi:hypothetical protein